MSEIDGIYFADYKICPTAIEILWIYLMPTSKKRLTLRKNNKLEGRYANYFKVGHNAYEFVIDFGQYYPENDQAELCTRIITSPAYAKSLLETLSESIEQYEKNHGSICVEDKDKPKA